MLDESEIYVKELSNTIINLYKLCIEEMGYDMGFTNNEIEYRNYLVNNPISIGVKTTNIPDSAFEPVDDAVIIKAEAKAEAKQAQVNNGLGQGFTELESGGAMYEGVYIPQTVINANQRILSRSLPEEFIDGVTKASEVTGIPVKQYILYAALESTFTDDDSNPYYKGWFQQPPNEGGRGTVYEQATGAAITRIYNEAIRDARKYELDKNDDDLAAWLYICHNCGNAGGRTMLKALDYNLRHDNIEDYRKAATAFANAYIKEKSRKAQILEKTASIPKAYYISYLLHQKNLV